MQPCCWLFKWTVRVEIFELCCSQARQGVAYTLHLSLLTAAVAQRVSQRIESMRHTLSCMKRTPGYHCCERALHGFADWWDGLFISPKTRSQKGKGSRSHGLIGLVARATRRSANVARRLLAAPTARSTSTSNSDVPRTMLARTALRRASLLGKSRAFASIGDKAPDVGLDVSFPGPKEVNFAQRCKGRRVILLGLPGAFTPT